MANDIDVGTMIEEIVEVPVPQPITIASASLTWGSNGQATILPGYILWKTLFVVMNDMNIDTNSYPVYTNYQVKWYGGISYNSNTGILTGLPYKSSFGDLGYSCTGRVFYINSASVGGGHSYNPILCYILLSKRKEGESEYSRDWFWQG